MPLKSDVEIRWYNHFLKLIKEVVIYEFFCFILLYNKCLSKCKICSTIIILVCKEFYVQGLKLKINILKLVRDRSKSMDLSD